MLAFYHITVGPPHIFKPSYGHEVREDIRNLEGAGLAIITPKFWQVLKVKPEPLYADLITGCPPYIFISSYGPEENGKGIEYDVNAIWYELKQYTY